MIKLGGRCIVQQISAEFECGGHIPLGVHPQNVALCYDVGKISTGCLVVCFFICNKHRI